MDWKLNKGHVCRESGIWEVLVGFLPSRDGTIVAKTESVYVCVPSLLGTGILEMRFTKLLKTHRSFSRALFR